MRFGIRLKLFLAILALVAILFSLAAYLFITEKKDELADDMYFNSLAFVQLTAPDIFEKFELYFEQSSFLYFNRELSGLMQQNPDVNRVQVISYAGELIYDSSIDEAKGYDGPKRMISDGPFLAQVKSENISFYLNGVGNVFLSDEGQGRFDFVDEDGGGLGIEIDGRKIDYFVVPVSERYVVVYYLDYAVFEARISAMVERIIYLAIFGVLTGLGFAIVLSGQFIRPVRKLVFGVEQIADGNFKARVDVGTRDEFNFLGDSFNRMAGDLEKSIEAKIYQDRVSNELKLAKEIQKRLLPAVIPSVRGVAISADLIPATEIGGDIYDFIKLSEEKLLFYLGDVTGHGVPAGIVSSIANALFYGYALNGDLKSMIVEVNRVMKAKTMPNMFMTMCLLLWNAQSEVMSYISAGHEQLVHYSAKQKKATFLPAGGIALGMVVKIENLLRLQEVKFEEGDLLVVYSDGIPECWKNEKELYGFERLLKVVERSGDLASTSVIRHAILADVKQFAGGYEQKDDITLIVVKRVSNEKLESSEKVNVEVIN